MAQRAAGEDGRRNQKVSRPPGRVPAFRGISGLGIFSTINSSAPNMASGTEPSSMSRKE